MFVISFSHILWMWCIHK